MRRIYLDNAAATQMDKRVFKAMEPFFEDIYYNPSALYFGARQARDSLEQARATVARLIGAKPSEIIFTAGGTESNNLAIQGVAQANPNKQILISAIEHEAVRKPAANYKYKIIKVDERGRLNIDDLKKIINADTVLVSVMYVNNEIGTIQDIVAITKIVKEERRKRAKSGNSNPIYVHTDACQAPLYLDVNVARLGVDLMSLNGGKIHGPKQSGVLYVKSGVLLKPQILGGGQEFGYRSGTENVAFANGIAKALDLANKNRPKRAKDVSELRDYFVQKLQKNFDVTISGHPSNRVANNVHAIFDNCDNERVLFALDELGVDVAMGSACSASSDEVSHVLLAIGKSEQQARSSIRFSLGKDTTKSEINKTVEILKIALKA
jgi:cysteine desulfurase